MKEGELTRLRSALVRTEQLAEFARQIDLGLAMRLGRGEDEGGGRERPALLCGTFEAVVGAIYLSDGVASVLLFIEPMLHDAVSKILTAHDEQDPKSLLQEWIQSQGYDHPLYRTVTADGPDHAKVFEVEVVVNGEVKGRGRGLSKQAAAKSAAYQALKTIGLYGDDAP
jgi:ribonuclease-3